ncbi:hypothetical protein M405DRAFT_818591, partial [Rhizopogon salebrosus TDB-379]
HHPVDYDNEDLSPVLKSRRPPPPVHTNDSDEDGGDRTPSPKPKHRHPLLDHNNHDDSEDLSPASKRLQRPHRQMSRERSLEEEQRPASVDGDEEDLDVRPKPKLRRPPEVRGDRKDPAPGSNGRYAGVPEQVHGPRPRHPTSPLPDLTDEDAIVPTAKLSGKTTPAPRKVQKGSKRAAATSRTQSDALRRTLGRKKANGYL